jgi:PIN domain nuclease of toxin-antitoxin system
MAIGEPMNLLLDTCALLALPKGTLPKAAAKALRTAPQAIISPMAVWELAIKYKTGKLLLDQPPLKWITALALRYDLIISREGPDPDLLCAAADLPLIHRDPFDRVLIATAQRENLTLITSDTIIPTYPNVSTLWK